MQLFDVHTHILPAFDDGAKTIEDSLELIACLKKQGICNICLTPHFYIFRPISASYSARRSM